MAVESHLQLPDPFLKLPHLTLNLSCARSLALAVLNRDSYGVV
jgi:hypothetical protein